MKEIATIGVAYFSTDAIWYWPQVWPDCFQLYWWWLVCYFK